MTDPATVFQRRLVALLSSLAAVIIVCIGLAVAVTARARSTIGQLADIELDSARLAREFRAEVNALQNALLRMGSVSPGECALAIREHRQQLRRWLTGRDAAEEPELQPVLRKLREELDAYLARLDDVAAREPSFGRPLSGAEIAAFDEMSVRLRNLADDFDQFHDNEERQLLEQSLSTVGSLRYLIYSCLALVGAATGATGVLFYRDLVRPVRTQLVRAEALLAKRQKLMALGTLAAGVAHEIRNPLTAIKARLFTLKRTLTGPEATEDVRAIASEIDRLERIVRDVLGYARPADPKLARIELRAWLRDVAAFIEPEMAARGIQIAVEAPAAVHVMADSAQLRQVIFNLSRNSAEAFEGTPGRITFSVTREPAKLHGRRCETALLGVTDNGPGIPPEIQHRLFEPFFTTKPTGTGLGLSTVAAIVEAHRGELSFQSAPGAGTRFAIRLQVSSAGSQSGSA